MLFKDHRHLWNLTTDVSYAIPPTAITAFPVHNRARHVMCGIWQLT